MPTVDRSTRPAPASAVAVPRRLAAARRLATVVRVVTPPLVKVAVQHRSRPLPTNIGSALAPAFAELGATYIKLGQLIASSPGLVGAEVADGFRALLDNAPPVPFPEVALTIERDLGRPLRALFADLDDQPIAAASMAVVHQGRLHDGRVVAVKVLRPGIEQLIATDLGLLEPLAAEVAAVTRTHEARVASDLVDGLRAQLARETDLTHEADAMVEARAVIAELGEHDVVVPEPIRPMCSKRVLTMEFVDGVAIDDLIAIRELGIDEGGVILALVRVWFASALRHGVFHGDIHAGNLLVLPDGRVALLDWGIVGRLDPEMHRMFRLLIAGALGDRSAWEQAAAILLARTFPPELLDQSGLSAADVAPVLQMQIGGMLTAPFNTVELSRMLEPPPFAIDREPRPTAFEAGRRLAVRRVRRPSNLDHASEVPFDAGFFLLVKQLAYFERYGKLYLDERPLLAEPHRLRAFITDDLAPEWPRSTGQS